MANTMKTVGNMSLNELIPDFVHMSGDMDVGSVGISSDLSVKNKIYVGTQDNEEYGTIVFGKNNEISCGINNFVMGKNNAFFGKESASIGNEGNKVGAKAFYWKAIDTTNKKIYLTKNLSAYRRAPGENEEGKINGESRFDGKSSNYYSKDLYKKYDVPYYGPVDPVNDPDTYQEISGLLTQDENINLEGLEKNTTITIYNTDNEKYIRCYQYREINGSVITYRDYTPSSVLISDEMTRFKYGREREYKPNYYTLYFPDMDQTKITCKNDAYVVHQTWGNLAVGDSNMTMGANSIALGQLNVANGNHSIAIGYGSKARGLQSIAMGDSAVCDENHSFVWKGKGKFVIDTDLSNIYIGKQTLKQALGLEP